MHKFNPKTKHNLYFQLLSTSGIRLLEPIMAIKIIAPNERISGIIADLSRRRAIIKEVTSKSDKNKVCRIYLMCKLKIKKSLFFKIISVNAPLAELSGYSTTLRTISSGTANMTMEPCGFSEMNPADESVAIRRAQGIETC